MKLKQLGTGLLLALPLLMVPAVTSASADTQAVGAVNAGKSSSQSNNSTRSDFFKMRMKGRQHRMTHFNMHKKLTNLNPRPQLNK
ncbi:hypothetical protein MOO44_04235 [Nicoliella spurrieriana]|uniref:Uncharacterized protein n=1 Tax=Nicoliella spurrieriana TaxID=2925830 RepID=A0A976RT73_9LACO|nr:hypothetical protein [Nicoliella spurrieriana]UQS87368.1 hypothetical protein MOO44_04235 [Nicoliella spurrieriana]